MVCLTQSSAQIIRIHYLTELEGGGGHEYFEYYSKSTHCCSLRSCSFESISDAMDTGIYTFYCTA